MPDLRTNARELRANMTDAERLLWRHLRRNQLGVRFRRQAVIGSFIADFACFRPRLVVELDGGQHQEQQVYDARRDAWLHGQGFVVLRFWNHDVIQNSAGVLEKISAVLKGLAAT